MKLIHGIHMNKYWQNSQKVKIESVWKKHEHLKKEKQVQSASLPLFYKEF
jgi:hypothetical protein